MDVTCDKCQTEYEFDDALVSEQGTSVRCTQCGHRFRVRRDASGTPEIWIVRTVAGQALEFRALRELKSAISAGRVGRDDVLSRGSGRPRRLASIAELEPFFTAHAPAPPAPAPNLQKTSLGLGAAEVARMQRRNTPHGLGPVSQSPMSISEASVAIPLATRESVPVNVPPPQAAARRVVETPAFGTDSPVRPTSFDDEQTVQRMRAVTRELGGLGEPTKIGPQAAVPVGEKVREEKTAVAPIAAVPPPRIGAPNAAEEDSPPQTLLGIAPDAKPKPPVVAAGATAATTESSSGRKIEPAPDSITKTMAIGTSRSASAASAEPTLGSAPAPIAPPEPAPAPAEPAIKPASEPPPRVAAKTVVGLGDPEPQRGKAARTLVSELEPKPSQEPSKGSGRAAIAPPPPVVVTSAPRASAADQDPTTKRSKKPVEAAAQGSDDAASAEPSSKAPAVKPKGRPRTEDARASVPTPNPPESRYSIADAETDRELGDRRTSTSSSRGASSSTRLFVALLAGGALTFLAVLVVQKFIGGAPTSAETKEDARVTQFLDAGEKAIQGGDLDAAKNELAKASALTTEDPRLAKAVARLDAIQADFAWLALRILTVDDPGRDAMRRQHQEAAERAQRSVDAAEKLSPGDPEITRIALDVRRIRGDLAGARKLAGSLGSLQGQAETGFVLGALDLAEPTPPFDSVIERLSTAANEEASLGRARALLVYALGRKGEGKRARDELERLARLPRPHPLEPGLRRFVERVEKGEDVGVDIDQLPTVAPTATASAVAEDPGDTMRLANEAMQRGQHDKAEELFQRVVDQDPSSVEGLSGLANVARLRGQTARAIAIYERVVAKAPSSQSAVSALADLKWDSGDRSGATALYRKLIDLGATGPIGDRARERTGGAAPTATAPTATAPTATAPTATAPTATAPTATAAPTAPPTATAPPAVTTGGDVPPWE